MTPENTLIQHDQIYGESRIDIPVAIDVIRSATFQRLKRINQYGVPDEFYHLPNFSRYEHSIGVMLLLKHLGASEEEQLAGLLHDVSHKAFSHVYDWVAGSAKHEDSQDKGHMQYIENSELAAILSAHGYKVEKITDYHRFGLLERESPDLCADRVDYALRELKPELAREIFKGLTVFNGQIVCKNLQRAAKFGRAFLKLQVEHWGGYEAVVRYHIFSGILKLALEKGIITPENFMTDDDFVTTKLKESGDEEISRKLNFLRQKPLPKTKEGITVHKKFRYIDPLFINNGKLLRLSEADEKFLETLEKAREENLKGVIVPNIN